MKEYSADKSGAPQKDAERPGSEHATDERRPGELNPAGGEGRLAGAAWRFGRQGEASEVADRTEEGPVPRSRSRDSAMRHLNAKLVSKLLRSTGIDLSAVLLSTDPSLAEQGKAGAAVEGREIKVAPGNEENEEVLAHEAGHIIQQMPVGARAAREASPKEGAGSVEGQETAPVTGEPGGSGPSGESKGLEQDVDLEAEADSVAAAVLAGEAVEVKGKASNVALYQENNRSDTQVADSATTSSAVGFVDGHVAAEKEKLATLRQMRIEEFIVLADEYAEKREAGEDIPDNEQVPYQMVREMIIEENISLLALWIGTANWGVSGVPDGLEDPAGLDWKGPPPKKGKRPRDYKKGGIGIAHFDGSRLHDTYSEFGLPAGLAHNDLYNADGTPVSFDELRRGDASRRDKWRVWAKSLAERDDFVVWCTDKWHEEYWEPAESSNSTLEQSIVNSRIRNSAPGVGKRLQDKPVEEQASGYEQYGQRRGQERGAKRTPNDPAAIQATADELEARHHRQMLQAQRVLVLVEYIVQGLESQPDNASKAESGSLPPTTNVH